MIRFLIAVALSSAVVGASSIELNSLRANESDHEEAKEVLYLPDGSALKVLSFGYQNVLSNLLWFKTINYFGKHYQGDQEYRWLSHMCALTTQLNPNAEHIYSFCSTMLSWEVQQPQTAYELLSQAIDHHPQYWRYRYLRGFISMYFLEDLDGAKEDFVTASKLPDAPVFLARMAASKMSLSDPEDAIQFLSNMLRTVDDPIQRAALEDKLRSLRSGSTGERLKKKYLQKTMSHES